MIMPASVCGADVNLCIAFVFFHHGRIILKCNEKDEEDRNNGDDYSFVNYAGDKRLGVTSMSFSIDFIKDGLLFKIPVYLIQGEDDIQTPVKITKEYFEKLKAPHKQFFLLPRTNHGFNQSVVDMHYKIMKMFIMPLIDKDR
jgi:pimeloyl-ACP methyl ester carboxylesterase